MMECFSRSGTCYDVYDALSIRMDDWRIWKENGVLTGRHEIFMLRVGGMVYFEKLLMSKEILGCQFPIPTY